MSRDIAAQINRFIASTHPRAPLAGQGEMFVRVGQRYGVDPRVLAIIARKESEFGSTVGRFRNNAWGWGVHLGPDVNTSRSWEEGASKVARGLAGSLYKGAGLNTLPQIINRYAPPVENDTGLYIRQISDWYRQMGGNPGANVFGPTASSPSPGGSTPVQEQFTAATAATPGQPLNRERLWTLLENQRKRSLRGLMPAPGFQNEIAKIAQQAMTRAASNVDQGGAYSGSTGSRAPMRPGAGHERRSHGPAPSVGSQVAFRAGGGPEAHHSRALGNWQSDDAYDLMGKANDPVYAGVTGTVTKISGKPGGDPGFAGYGITVNTPQGQFFFKHLNTARVRVGQRITPSTLIGTLDPVTAGGPHLHLGGTNRAALDRLSRWYLSGGGR